MYQMILKPGKEKSLLRKHPWIFSGAVSSLPAGLSIGDTVQVIDARGGFLAWAAFNPYSQIVGRVWSWDLQEIINEAFFRRRIQQAIQNRHDLLTYLRVMDTNAIRLVYAESDGLPGLIVDQYADVIVFQFLTAGVEKWKDLLSGLVSQITGKCELYERSDVDVRRLEGLAERSGVISNSEFNTDLIIQENGLQFKVDVARGHKTGFYLDQHMNRFLVRGLARERDVLDCFCYTGGFTCAALAGGARSVYAVDSSTDALSLVDQNITLNGLDRAKVDLCEGDVFRVLRELRDRGRSFDLIILDPPKFAMSQSQVEHAARGYKDINLLSFKLLRPGGVLVTFSCSGSVNETLFQKIIAGAALDAGVEARILQRLTQSPDHPVALNFPEGAYLKGYVIQVSN
jgi:23S rRNA (cytosine1962-C5)-methyltransferase